MSRLGLDPARWQVAFETLAENETPAERAACAPGKCGPHFVFLDPLAGFDAEIAAAATAMHTQAAPRTPPLVAPADFLAALARAIYDLLGGRPGLSTPLPALDGPRNEMLLAALQRRADFSTARDWAAAFMECGGAATPLLERAERGGSSGTGFQPVTEGILARANARRAGCPP